MSGDPATLQMTLRHGIWRLTLDGRFFADYRTARQAEDGLALAASALRREGRAFVIVRPPEETTQQ